MLRNYIYIDSARLDMFVEQIASSRPKDKKIKKTVGLSLTGPKVEASEETAERSLTIHEKIELLIKYLGENDLLDTSRPKGTNENVGKQRFVFETMDARKIIVPEEHLKHLPGVKHFAIWISDPDPQDYVPMIRNNVDADSRFREPSDYYLRGTFVYLTEAWLDNDAYGTTYSGCSALQAIANAIDGKPLIGYGSGGELLGCGSFDHPIMKLERLGALRGDLRRITSLYYKRYITNEQCYIVDGQERCVNDLLGYPIFIAAEM
jgi:hypothetical protein